MIAALTWRALELWPVATAVAAALLFALLLFYVPQMRSIGQRFAFLPPLLRIAAVAALAVSILRPVLVRTRAANEEGEVVVLLDRSLSMSSQDRGIDLAAPDHAAVIGELMTLADSLGRLDPELRAASGIREIRRLAALVDDIARARRTLEFAGLSGRDPRDAQRRLDAAINDFLNVAKSAEQTIQSAAPRAILDQLTRLAQPPRPEDRNRWSDRLPAAVARAEEQAMRFQGQLDAELYNTNEQARLACDELARLSRLGLAWDTLAGDDNSLLDRLERSIPLRAFSIGDRAVAFPIRRDIKAPSLPLEADAAASDLLGGIAGAVQQVGRQPLQAIVLFSDGRQVNATTALPPDLLPPQVPIFTVYAASPNTRDLAIHSVNLPTSAFVNEAIAVRLGVRLLHLDPARLTGEVDLAIGETSMILPPRIRGTPKAHTLDLPPLRLRQPGPQKLIVNLPVQDGEVESANNHVERWIKVLEQKLKVAAISSSPAWDFRFLRDVLQRTDWVQLHHAVVAPGSRLAMRPEQILQQDLVVLHDPQPDMLAPNQWAALRQLVHARGGTVILIAGPSLTREVPPGVLRELLPWEPSVKPLWQLWPGQNPSYHMLPAANLDKTAAFRLDDDEETSRRRWDDLPGFFRYLFIPTLKSTARPLLVERQSLAPLLVEDRFGSGRVLLLGMNETWRWRRQAAGRDQDRFWLQLVRYAMDEPYALTTGLLSFDLDRFHAQPDQPVHLRARVVPSVQHALPEQLEVQVLLQGELYRKITLTPAGAAGAGRYSATVADLPDGNYELKLSTPAELDSFEELILPLEIEHTTEVERADLSGDRDFLQRLADSTGGKCLNLDQVATLPQLLREARERHPRATELHLWTSPYLLVFVLACLSVEWALRKRFGLP